MIANMKRPSLNEKVSLDDFQNFYWLKEELINFYRVMGINTTGGKIDITNRIKTFLSTGTIIKSVEKKKTNSKFNWNNSELRSTTTITDNYKNTENVRSFMIEQIGKHFYFNTAFMNWAKSNIGKSLGDAIVEWKRIYKLKKDKNYKTDIAPQFEYNTYIRDFLADSSDKNSKEAIKFWKLKRQQRGSKKYSKNDLFLTED